MFALESVAVIITGCLLTALVKYAQVALFRLIVPGDLCLVKYVLFAVFPHFALCAFALTAGLLGIGPGAPIQGICIFIFGEAIILLAGPKKFSRVHEAFVSLKYFSPSRFSVGRNYFHAIAAKTLLTKLFESYPNAVVRFEKTEEDYQLRLVINDKNVVDLYVNSESRFFEGLEIVLANKPKAKGLDDALAIVVKMVDNAICVIALPSQP